jgi:hypothetical protein
MAKRIISTNKLVETFSDQVQLFNAIGLQNKIRDFSIPDLEINFNNGGIEFLRGSGVINFKRASEATYIDTDGILKKSDIDEPRVEQNGLLLESDAFNYIQYSEDFSKNADKLNSSVTTLGTTVKAPDNLTIPFKLVESTADGFHGLRWNDTNCFSIKALSNSWNTYIDSHPKYKWMTFSVFVKAAERSEVCLRYISNAVTKQSIAFDLATGTIDVSKSSWNFDYGAYPDDYNQAHIERNNINSVARIQKIAKSGVFEASSESWYRISITFYTGPTANTIIPEIHLLMRSSSLDPDVNYQYPGNGSSGIYIWGAQFENSSYPTSYIYSNSNTTISHRMMDFCWISRASENVPYPWTGNTSYVVDFDVLSKYDQGGADYNGFRINDPTEARNYSYIQNRGSRSIFRLGNFEYQLSRVDWLGRITSYYDATPDYITTISSSELIPNVADDNRLIRLATVYSGNSFSSYVDGNKVFSDIDSSPRTIREPTIITLGCEATTFPNDRYGDNLVSVWNVGAHHVSLHGHIKSFRIFRRALSHEELTLC